MRVRISSRRNAFGVGVLTIDLGRWMQGVLGKQKEFSVDVVLGTLHVELPKVFAVVLPRAQNCKGWRCT